MVGTRCAIIGLAGRPNVGKSTLVNALVGEKVAIVSHKPQTTRRSIRGVLSGDGWQLIFTDLPGVQRPLDQLTQRMQRTVERELADADAVLFIVDAAAGIGPGDRFIAHALSETQSKQSTPVLVAVNKVDRLKVEATAAALIEAERLVEKGLEIAEILPISAHEGRGLEPLVQCLAALAPEGPMLFPIDQRTDLPEALRVAELIREQVLERTRAELPHAVEVVVEEVEQKTSLTVVRALLWAESPSQRAILIGRAGRMIREIGTAARRELERHFGSQVHLDLRVRVEKDWRKRAQMLDRLGLKG